MSDEREGGANLFGEAAGNHPYSDEELQAMRRATGENIARLVKEATGSEDEDDTLQATGILRPRPTEAAAGDSAPAKRIRSTRTKHRPGVLRVKEYPITEDTLDNIGTLRVSAAIWCAVGSLFLGFGLSALTSLLMAGAGVSATAHGVWIAIIAMTGFMALIAYAAGGFYFWKGQSVIQFVKENTVHDPIE